MPREAPPDPYLDLRLALADEIQREIPYFDPKTPIGEELRVRIVALAREKVASAGVPEPDAADLVAAIVSEVGGYGPLEPLFKDPRVTEILVNGPRQVYAEIRGRLHLTKLCFRDELHVRRMLERLVPMGGAQALGPARPILDARLIDGSRLNAVAPPVAVDGLVVTIRKRTPETWTLERLVRARSLSVEAARYLAAAVRGRMTVVVSGGTSSGKTVLVSALSGVIPSDERIIVIEDTSELQLLTPHTVRLEAKGDHVSYGEPVTIRDLVRAALRMRPDRIIIGEVRGTEALDLINALNTGHRGSLTTLHANSPREALQRLETLLLIAYGENVPLAAIRAQIASAIQVVVQTGRFPDGRRGVIGITEVYGVGEDLRQYETADIFVRRGTPDDPIGTLAATGIPSRWVGQSTTRPADA